LGLGFFWFVSLDSFEYPRKMAVIEAIMHRSNGAFRHKYEIFDTNPNRKLNSNSTTWRGFDGQPSGSGFGR